MRSCLILVVLSHSYYVVCLGEGVAIPVCPGTHNRPPDTFG
jgi:hypothetical protein